MPKRGSWTPFETIQRAARGIAVALALKAGATQAAALTVNTTADNTTADANLTLREAILLVNNAGDANAALGRPLNSGEQAQISGPFGTNANITFDPALNNGSIDLLSGQLPVREDVTITGPGASLLAVDAQNASRVFNLYNPDRVADVAITGLTLAGGAAGSGGGIWSSEKLLLDDVTVTGCSVTGNGGGIYSSGPLTITNSTISGNYSDYNGAGINAQGSLTLDTVTVENNKSYYYAGGVLANGPAEVTDCLITGNYSQLSCGGLYAGGSLTMDYTIVSNNSAFNTGGVALWNSATITNSTITGNTARSSAGINCHRTATISNSTISGNMITGSGYSGGVYNTGNLTLTGSTISGNSATRSGGGIYTYYGTLTVTGSTISGNSAGSTGGGIQSKNSTLTVTGSTVSGNSANSTGGGIQSITSTLTVTDSTISGNSAAWGGGLRTFSGTANVINSTISGNTAKYYGGGIYNSATLVILNSTITENLSDYNNDNNTPGGGLYAPSGNALLQNTIVSGNKIDGGGASDIYGSVNTASAYNLIGSGSGFTGITNGVNNNKVGVDPLLGPLQNNGGPTATHLPMFPSSPAIDAAATGPAYDQRGAPRPQGAAFDLGAVEVLLIDPNDWDGDGIPNGQDDDDDGDGVTDLRDPDRDGDGVNDDLDPAPDDPFDAGPNGMLGVPGLSVQKVLVKLDFDDAGKDKVVAKGTFPIPPGFVSAGAQVDVDVGGQTQTFTLDEKGKAKTGDDTFKLRVSKRGGADGTFNGRWTLIFKKGTFAVSDAGGAPFDGSSPGTANRVLKMTLSVEGANPDLRYNVGTVVYKSTAIKGSAKNKKP